MAAHRVILTDQVVPDVERKLQLRAGVDAGLIVPVGGRRRRARESHRAHAATQMVCVLAGEPPECAVI